MKLVLVLCVVALASVQAASADVAVPTGFWANARLSKPASWVAGKPVTAYCAHDIAALQAVANQDEAGVSDVQGVTPIVGGDVIYLSPLTCAYLDAWLNGKKPSNLYGVAGSMLTIAHEADHAKGLRDETDTDCAALHALPHMAVTFFPLKKRESLRDLMFDATRGHLSKAAEYHTHPC